MAKNHEAPLDEQFASALREIVTDIVERRMVDLLGDVVRQIVHDELNEKLLADEMVRRFTSLVSRSALRQESRG